MAVRITEIPAAASPAESAKRRRAAAYARVSTDHEDQMTSYAAQVEHYTYYIRERSDLEFVEVYTDEGITGTSTKRREGFKRMMADALAGNIDLIITKSVSRFARNTVDCLSAIRLLKEHGVEVFFEKENIRTFDSRGELLLSIMASIAQEESRSISENCKWGQRRRFAEGKVTVPFKRFLGYDRGEDGGLVINEEQAAVVRRIYDEFLNGATLYAIAKSLTEDGIPTPGGREKWSGNVVKSILTNEKYKGDALLQKVFTVDYLTKRKKKNNGEVTRYYVEGSHEPIIPPGIFDEVRGEFERRKTQATSGMVVQHNINAMTAYNKLNVNVTGLKKSSEKLASGYRINRAGDDAAGLAVSEKMRAQIKGLKQAIRNSQDGINMIQTYEGAATNTHEILQRMRVLAEESANGTYDNTTDRDAIQLEFKQLNDELNQIADTDFNGRVALNGGTMADGTVATNNTTIAGKPQVRTNVVADPASAETYMKQVTGGVDKAGNGSIIINGTSVDLKGGKGGATVGSTTYAAKDIVVDDATGAIKEDGEITATTYVKVNADTTEVTIFGKKYNTDITIVTAQDVADYNTAKQAAFDQFAMDYAGDPTALANAKTNWVTANPAPVEGASGKLLGAKGEEVTAIDGANVSFDAATSSFKIEETYKTIAGGDVLDNDGAGSKIGTIGLSKGVSVSDAFEHGRRNLTYSNSITLQTGSRSKDAVDFTFEYTTSGIGDLNADLDISSRGLGTAQLSLITAEKANEAIDHIDNAINKVSMVRATFGAIQNRLEYKIDNMTTTQTNLQEAESNIRDTDMADEMMNYTKYNILQQAAQSMLAQANQQPQSVLQLLG